MGLLNAWMLPLLAVIGLPIIIHLLFRRRPRPMPWAAMHFLRLAQQKTQRRWRLDQWLLLLFRCLILTLFVLALVRPYWGVTGARHVVLVFDRSASMGERTDGPGALAEAIDTLLIEPPQAETVTVLSVNGSDIALEANGSWQEAAERLRNIRAGNLPGGLDTATPWDSEAAWLRQLTPDAQVLLISDFRQDAGSGWQERLDSLVAGTSRWARGYARSQCARERCVTFS